MIKYPTRSQYDDALGVPRLAFKSELLQSAKFLKVRDTHQRSTGSFAFLAKAEIENQKQAAITDLKNQVADLSVQLAEVLLKDSLTEEQKQKALNHSLIKEFGAN